MNHSWPGSAWAARPSTYVNLGPHPPRLWPEDVDRLHELWLRLSESKKRRRAAASSGCRGVGLAPAGKELTGAEREEILRELEQDLRKSY